MTIVKLTDGGLWVHSPTAISEELKQSVDAIGAVAYLVARMLCARLRNV